MSYNDHIILSAAPPIPTRQSPAPTFEDVWRTIQELALLSKETDRKFQETDRIGVKQGTDHG